MTDVAIKRPPWRPRKKLPRNAIERIEELAAAGHTWTGVAKAFHMTAKTFVKHRDENPMIDEAYNRGRDALHFEMQDMLIQKARGGDTMAIQTILNSRFGWRNDNQDDSRNKVQVIFQLPGALSPDDYKLKVIEGNAKPVDRIEQLPTTRIGRS